MDFSPIQYGAYTVSNEVLRANVERDEQIKDRVRRGDKQREKEESARKTLEENMRAANEAARKAAEDARTGVKRVADALASTYGEEGVIATIPGPIRGGGISADGGGLPEGQLVTLWLVLDRTPRKAMIRVKYVD